MDVAAASQGGAKQQHTTPNRHLCATQGYLGCAGRHIPNTGAQKQQPLAPKASTKRCQGAGQHNSACLPLCITDRQKADRCMTSTKTQLCQAAPKAVEAHRHSMTQQQSCVTSVTSCMHGRCCTHPTHSSSIQGLYGMLTKSFQTG